MVAGGARVALGGTQVAVKVTGLAHPAAEAAMEAERGEGADRDIVPRGVAVEEGVAYEGDPRCLGTRLEEDGRGCTRWIVVES